MDPASPQVILGVSAGIAGYKARELPPPLAGSGRRGRGVPTRDGLRFVGEPTWAALSGQPVTTDVWTGVDEVPHVRLGQSAGLVVVAPATADLLARAAAGRADALLTATLLTARCPVLYAPAMHTEMWEHPATRENVARLRERGAVVLDPARGRRTGADSGPGRGTADRSRSRPGPAARARGDLLGRRPAAGPGPPGARPGPDRPHGRRVGRRHPRGAGCGAGPGQLVLRPPGLRLGREPGG